ncbi:MAG: PhzF family phenazine biosynthesis protein [Firmicutes bacterium]|nr:PhzF family phenazine biosynthesis protein [Bacillota bacterium]
MIKLSYKKIDAFTGANSGGNPAACVYLAKGQCLSPEDMQKIAAEHKGFVSEVVFCTPLGNNAYRLRYYASECEVAFCGHGTIACIYQLLKDAGLLGVPEIFIQTNKGTLKVLNRINAADAVYISAPQPLFIAHTLRPSDIADALGVDARKISAEHPIEIVDAGLRTLLVPIHGLDDLLAMRPDEKRLKEYSISNAFDTVAVFSREVAGAGSKLRTRVFPPRFGYLEDPATGSGNSAIGYYMLRHGMWDGSPINIEQNGSREKHNIVKLRYEKGSVYFGGGAALRIDGTYFL